MISTSSRRRQARAARAQVEDAIDASGGRYSRRLSLLLDLWIVAEGAD